ncbi:aldehyde dehydrogenase (NADP(+)) [Gordonia sp. CPCC 205515]|uniref:aldehyde dehydrogenase (NADP(+)) n=1 Tax=Gordonia sp. CPCC 205515 TaxID=3140791 RepID=UPI003AF3F40A
MPTPSGQMIIAGSYESGTGINAILAINPATGEQLEPAYRYATIVGVTDATTAAAEAFPTYRATTSEARAVFLDTIADNLDAAADPIIERAVAESGLPVARITGEVARTAGQLRLFAAVLREGSWQGARIDPALPDRKPLPRPDIRQRKIPLGPVAVFGASNFPLAFSVAGGDTASALAAGCPVVVKAHDAHPGTSELVGRAITDAVSSTGMPAGTFSLINGGNEIGAMLVTDPHIKAVGFTGSRAGGLALVHAAASRPEPIPVYAEMSSINPVYPLPGALAERAEELGEAFVGSLTMGSGQFCTNPGLVIAVDGPDLDRFVTAAAKALGDTSPTPMLTPGIARAYASGVQHLAAAATTEARGQEEPAGPHTCRGALFSTDAATFLSTDELRQEVFGASSVVVRCQDAAELVAVTDALEGQLTASLHSTDDDLAQAGDLMSHLELKAGRIIFNGWPTGVEVCHAMVHGGPYPATSDPRSTSVGSLAIERFLRPVAYQNTPADLLPAPIADGNPDQIWRRIDGRLSQD